MTGRRRSVPGQGDADPGTAAVHQEHRSRHELGGDKHHEEDARASTDVHRSCIARSRRHELRGGLVAHASRFGPEPHRSPSRTGWRWGPGVATEALIRARLRDHTSTSGTATLELRPRRRRTTRPRSPWSSTTRIRPASSGGGSVRASPLGRLERSRLVHPLGPKCLPSRRRRRQPRTRDGRHPAAQATRLFTCRRSGASEGVSGRMLQPLEAAAGIEPASRVLQTLA